MTQARAAQMLGWHTSTVERYVRRYSLPRPRGRTGPICEDGHYNWRGGRTVDKGGYVLIYCENHHSGRRYVREHRLVMEEILGRPLLRDEVVHHVNGVRDDNRPENLRLFQRNADHLRHELTGRCPKWTPEGRARTLDGVRRANATRRRRKERDDGPSQEASARSTDDSGTAAQ